MRESLNIASDTPDNIFETEKKFKELIPHLDFSEIDKCEDKLHYYLWNIDEWIKDKIYADLEITSDQTSSNAFDIIMKTARPYHPGAFESRWNIIDRCTRVKKFIKKYIEDNQIPIDQKIILSAHFVFFYTYTGSYDREYSRDEVLPKPDHYITLKNCQFLNDPTDFNSL